MDWGLGNPNKTAALIACLMIAACAIAYKWRKGFWWALPIFTILSGCLVQTYSRGGMLALLGGVVVLLIWTPRPWPRARCVAVLASLWIATIFILYAKAEMRYGQGLFTEDQSIKSRLIIWKKFPEMLAAAPWGWGWGKAGDAYTQWFQPTDQSINYLNLVNSHFTWMAEGGWLASALYLSTWMIVLLLCWPSAEIGLNPVPLATWTAFGIAACFSHVEESIWLWILPLAALSFAVWKRLQARQWPALSGVGLGAVMSVCIVAGLILIGWAGTVVPIQATSRAVTLGQGPVLNVIFVDRDVMGKLYGHAFRRYLETNPEQLTVGTFIVTESSDYKMATKVHELIVSGRTWSAAGDAGGRCHADQIILINPEGDAQKAMWDKRQASNTCVYFGEYSQDPSRSSWESCPGIKTLVIGGGADFVPTWPQAVLKSPGT